MYQIIETQYDEKSVIKEFATEEEAKKFFDNRVTAFIEGNDEEEILIDEDNAHHFFASYENGEEYKLEIVETEKSVK